MTPNVSLPATPANPAPHVACGFVRPSLLLLVDCDVYGKETYPVGRWDGWLFYHERFRMAVCQVEADSMLIIEQPDAVAALIKDWLTGT